MHTKHRTNKINQEVTHTETQTRTTGVLTGKTGNADSHRDTTGETGGKINTDTVRAEHGDETTTNYNYK